MEARNEGTGRGVTGVRLSADVLIPMTESEGNLQHFVRLDQAVLDGFLQTHTRSLLILKDADVEGEVSSLLLDFRVDSTGSFHFELVADGRVTLVDGRPCVFRAGLRFGYEAQGFRESVGETHLAIFARRNEDVDAVHFTFGESGCLELALLSLAWVEDYSFLAIDDILCLLAREHA